MLLSEPLHPGEVVFHTRVDSVDPTGEVFASAQVPPGGGAAWVGPLIDLALGRGVTCAGKGCVTLSLRVDITSAWPAGGRVVGRARQVSTFGDISTATGELLTDDDIVVATAIGRFLTFPAADAQPAPLPRPEPCHGSAADALSAVRVPSHGAARTFRLRSTTALGNAYGVMHGGVQLSALLMAMQDVVGPDANLVDVTIDYQRGIESNNKDVVLSATPRRLGRRLGLAAAHLSDASGLVLASASATFSLAS